MTPTPQQDDFYRALLGTTANIALVARAGCGKTTTIIGGVQALLRNNPRLEIMVCAYNKAINDEVEAKFKALGLTDWRQLSCKTLHGAGFGLLRFAFNNPKVDDKKVRNLIDAQNDGVYAQYGSQIGQLVRYAKQAGFGFFNDVPIGSVDAWHQLADHFDVNGLDETDDADAVVEAAQVIYRASLSQTDIIDYDDMVLLPLVKNLRVKFAKDVVFVDEAQDLSRARQALARKFVKPHTGRMIIVGDDKQAIYGFSGADAAALPNLIEALNATVLPLSVTWRCPKAVVALAQGLVPDIEAASGAPEGSVTYVDELPDDLGPDDFIGCRNTAPLIKIAYKLIRAGKPCKVEGRAIGEGLQLMVRRWKVKTIDALLNRLDAYRDREVQKALAKNNDAKVEEIEDKVATLVEICNAVLAKGLTGVADVSAFIDNLFADGATGVTILATYHRLKGREADRVFLWEHSSRCPSKAARQPWALAQEANLAYVAFTRAKKSLVFVG